MPPPGYYPPPRHGGGGGGAVGAVLAVLVVFVMVGGLVAFATMAGHDNSSSSYATSTPSFTYTTPTWPSSTESSSYTTSSAPTSTRSGYRTTTAVTTTKPAGPQPVAATATNPLFADQNSGLINISCDYPQWGSNVAAAKAFFQAATSCLDRMWQPVLAAQNLPFSSPTVSVPVSDADTVSPCTSSGGSYAAFYCSVNNTIYMPLNHIQTEMYGDRWYIYLNVFAHEYGHHIQAISGISQKSNRDRYNAGVNSSTGLELSRRLELEAQCFDGMFMGSSEAVGTVSTDQANFVKKDNYERGDDNADVRDHGQNQHYGAWYTQGQENNRTWMCNTWSSPSDAVS